MINKQITDILPTAMNGYYCIQKESTHRLMNAFIPIF